MKRTHVLICLMFCFISSIDCANKSIDTRPKKIQSEEKLKIVQSLTEKLQKKKVSLDQNSQIFEQEILTNVQEIQVERSKGLGNDFKSAMSNKRIENSLKAIQKASAYKEVVTHEAEKTEAGVIELEGTTKQLRLDITVLGALEDEKGDEILAQLDLVINHIQPQAEDLVISPDTPKKPLEEIFNKYILQSENQSNAPAKQPEPAIIPIPKQETKFSSSSINEPLQPNYTLILEEVLSSPTLLWSPENTLLAIHHTYGVAVWDYIGNSIVRFNGSTRPESAIWAIDGKSLLLAWWPDNCIDCKYVNSQDEDENIYFKFWSIKTSTIRGTYQFPLVICNPGFYDNRGNYLIIVSCDAYRIWDYKQGIFVKTIPINSNIAWRDNNSFYYNDNDTIYLHSLDTGYTETLFSLCIIESSQISSRQCPKSVLQIAWNNLDTLAISMEFTHTVKGDHTVISFFNTSSRAKIGTVEVTSVRQLWWQNNTDLMYLLSQNLLARINTQSLAIYDTFHLQTDNISVSIINNDKHPTFFVVWSNNDLYIKENNTFEKGQKIFLASPGEIYSVAWSNDGKMLAAVSEKKALYVWDLHELIN